jgi:3-oxoacyl-(acyl-carrier-protein) synthase
MRPATPPIRIAAFGALTAFGDESVTLAALLEGRRALVPRPVFGTDENNLVPLAICTGRAYAETAPPGWLPHARNLAARIPGEGWGSPRRPVFVTSSNFGAGNLLAFRRTADSAHLPFSAPFACVDWLVAQLGWGPNVTTFSHACVSAHLGLMQASRVLAAGLADEALVFSFDFLSPFVVGGFHALKILNADFPAPYQDRPSGSIGLGDGAAFAVLTRDRGDFTVLAQGLHNEMYHFTSNRPDGSGFDACLAALPPNSGERCWLKGHGTGTLEAGWLEASVLARHFPGAPLVSWKGGIGHTLGSCGLVELAIALAAIRAGRAPGTVGSEAPGFTPEVAFAPFELGGFDRVLCTSNAFGGAHAALLLGHA